MKDPTERTDQKVTWKRPNVLLSVEVDANNGVVKHVREGGLTQFDLKVSVEWSNEKVDESPNVLKVLSENRINFAGGVIQVINDEVRIGAVFWQVTKPSASEYKALLGKEAMIYFDCSKDQSEMARLGRTNDTPIYKIVRHFITLQ